MFLGCRKGIVAAGLIPFAAQAFALSPSTSFEGPAAKKPPRRARPAAAFVAAAGLIAPVALLGCVSSRPRPLSDEEIRIRLTQDLFFFADALSENRGNPALRLTILREILGIFESQWGDCPEPTLLRLLRRLEPRYLEESEPVLLMRYLHIFARISSLYPDEVGSLLIRDKARVERTLQWGKDRLAEQEEPPRGGQPQRQRFHEAENRIRSLLRHNESGFYFDPARQEATEVCF